MWHAYFSSLLYAKGLLLILFLFADNLIIKRPSTSSRDVAQHRSLAVKYKKNPLILLLVYILLDNFTCMPLRPQYWMKLLIKYQKLLFSHRPCEKTHSARSQTNVKWWCAVGNWAELGREKDVVWKKSVILVIQTNDFLWVFVCVWAFVCSERKRRIKARAFFSVYCCVTWRKHWGYLSQKSWCCLESTWPNPPINSIMDKQARSKKQHRQ